MLMLNGNKVAGISYVPVKGRTHKNEVEETIVRAREYVVPSSGTLGASQNLKRPGVGNAKLLKVVSDL